jgi:uncharacterized protein YbdZ (MbtH family)
VSINPFDDEDGFGQETRASCLAYVEENWTHMRPKGLREANPLIKA